MSRAKETKRGTYRITFKNGDQAVFGNNYKPWWQHATEYIYRYHGSPTEGWRYIDVEGVVTEVSYSNQLFYDDGGLKWCDIKSYQAVIDDVCKQDSLAPVKLEDIVFTPAPKDHALLLKKLQAY
jgi:hypothetical protein